LRDGLTGLLNRRALSIKLSELHSLCQRYGNAYSVILLDIDHFKLLNDSQGHLHGDAVLKIIAEALEGRVRISDSVYRYGGEEFLVALPETDGEETSLVAERIREKISSLEIAHPDSPTAAFVTASLGYTDVHSRHAASLETWERVVERADRALYAAKHRGRNCIVGWDEVEWRPVFYPTRFGVARAACMTTIKNACSQLRSNLRIDHRCAFSDD
jgi:diguanylate cyclase (GGDEF)-like protein